MPHPPLPGVAGEPARGEQRRHRRPHRIVGRPVRHREADPGDLLPPEPSVARRLRRERDRPDLDPRQAHDARRRLRARHGPDLRHPGFAVQPRRAQHLERGRRPAADGEVGPLEQTGAGIVRGALQRRHVERRRDPGKARLVEPAVRGPARGRDDVQLHLHAERSPVQAREFSRRESVPHGHRVQADEGREGGVQHGTLREAADRIRAVEDDHGDARAPRRLHRERHRRDVRVVARADVLDIEREHVDRSEHLRRGRPRLAVQRVDRQPRPFVRRVVDRGALRFRAPDPVLGREERREFRVRVAVQEVDGTRAVAPHAAPVRDQPHAPPVDEMGGIGEQHIDAGPHRRCGRVPAAPAADSASAPPLSAPDSGPPHAAIVRRRRRERKPASGFISRRVGSGQRARDAGRAEVDMVRRLETWSGPRKREGRRRTVVALGLATLLAAGSFACRSSANPAGAGPAGPGPDGSVPASAAPAAPAAPAAAPAAAPDALPTLPPPTLPPPLPPRRGPGSTRRSPVSACASGWRSS